MSLIRVRRKRKREWIDHREQTLAARAAFHLAAGDMAALADRTWRRGEAQLQRAAREVPAVRRGPRP